MKVVLKEDLLVLVPETDEERTRLGGWKCERAGHVLHVAGNTGVGLCLVDLGERADACREPINVISASRDPRIRLISNFAPTPFQVNGREYASVEGFWQGLYFEDEVERQRIAALEGLAAKRASQDAPSVSAAFFEGRRVAAGTWEHWQLMRRACWAKFTQNPEAREALLSTGERPLTHRTRRDSRTIPGVIMADIWMRIRARLREQPETELEGVPADNRILFYRRDRVRFGFLSNFHPAPIQLGGEEWATVEHYYQAQKSDRRAYRQAIREAATPGQAKRLGSTPSPEPPADATSWFALNRAQPRPDWGEVKLEIMREAVRAKFTQNAGLGALLRATGTAQLIEDSKSDTFWGIGRDGDGQNWLGRLLAEVRDLLQAIGDDTNPDGDDAGEEAG